MPLNIEKALGPTAAILLGVYADLAFNAFSALNSSPQTTELFAAEREETLLKYVYIADVAVLGMGVLGAFMAVSLWPFVGSAAVVVGMHFLYMHAVAAGNGG